MSNVHAVTEDLKFEARIAYFCELDDQAKKDLSLAVSAVLQEQSKKHGYLVWRVQLFSETRK